MTALHLYDAAYGTDKYAAVKAHGGVAVSHYMTRGYSESSFQVTRARAEGLGVLQNWEGTAAELKGASRAKGRASAHEALAAVAAGTPRDNTIGIYYSVDTDLIDLTVCDEAFRGINDAHAGSGLLVKVYGEGGLIKRLHGMGLVQGGQWLSMSEGFGGFHDALTSGLVALVQMHDASGNWIGTDIDGTDRNTIINPASAGIWWPNDSPLTSEGKDWFDMATEAQLKSIVQDVVRAELSKGVNVNYLLNDQHTARANIEHLLEGIVKGNYVPLIRRTPAKKPGLIKKVLGRG